MTLLQILRQSVEVLDFFDTSYSLTWLHLSDLHFGLSKTAKGQIILDELLSDIGKLTHQIGSPDFIFITGDVGFTANPNEYEEAKKWIDRLLTVTNTSKDKLYIVPGNHDIDRNLIARTSIKTIHENLRDFPVKLDEYLSPTSALLRPEICNINKLR